MENSQAVGPSHCFHGDTSRDKAVGPSIVRIVNPNIIFV